MYKHREIETIFTGNLMNMHGGIGHDGPAWRVGHIHNFMRMNLGSALE